MHEKKALVEFRDSVGIITLHDPQILNALSEHMISDLLSCLDEAEAHSRCRVVILIGSGKAFVAGADISYMAKMGAEEACRYAKNTVEVYKRMRSSQRIFIAAVNGYALGGGCELALACDFRIASEQARFGLPEVGLGILPGGTGTQSLSRAVGVQKAMELILTGQTIRADEAVACGLALRAVPAEALLENAVDLAKKICQNAPLAVSYAKKCMIKSQELSFSEGSELENALFGLCFAHGDQAEGMNAFLEKRAAIFHEEL